MTSHEIEDFQKNGFYEIPCFDPANLQNQSDEYELSVFEDGFPGSTGSCRSGPEVRFINAAIYAESIENEEEEENEKNRQTSPVKIEKFGTHKFTTDSSLSTKKDQTRGNTYQCNSISSPTIASFCTSVASDPTQSMTSISTTLPRTERRCKISSEFKPVGKPWNPEGVDPGDEILRYSWNGCKVVQLSTSQSSSSSSDRLTGPPLIKKIAHEEWVRRKLLEEKSKKEEESKTEEKRRAEEERIQLERENREKRERENFLKWTERKRKEEAAKKAILEKELELEKRLKEVEERAAVAKTLCLQKWARKKEEEHKVQLKELQLKQKQEEQERMRRLEESSKAYERWREKSKNKAKPATQGLLPHQTAKPAYVNPQPWQQILEDAVDEQASGEKSPKKRVPRDTRRGKLST